MKTILSLICLLSFATLLDAQKAGTLDKSFGDSGKVVFYSYGTSNAVGVLSTGKIVTAGNGSAGDQDFGYEVVCYNEDGSFDSAFGKNGFTILNDQLQYGEPFALSVLPNDFIVTAGSMSSNILLVKLKPDGSLDSTFGENGIAISGSDESEYIKSMQIQTDGKIVVAGEVDYNDYTTRAVVLRYMADGTADKSFGDKGKVTFDVNTTAGSVALQKDGKIVIGGKYFDGANHFFLARLTTVGNYDKSFGKNGNVVTDFKGFEEYVNSIVIQPNGKILAAGVSGGIGFNDHSMSAARYDEKGNLDTSFGIKGEIVVKFSASSEATAVLLQNDNKFILSGETSKNNQIFNTALCRLKEDGSIDSSFGTNGLSETDFGGDEIATSAALQKDGKIVITGYSYINNGYYDILARYNNNGESKKQKIISKIKHYIQNHNNLESSSTADAKAATLNISLAPNPVNSILSINGLSAINNYQLKIINASGNVVAVKQVSNISSYQINVQSLSAGVYYINIISNNNQSTTLKFIKQ